MLWPGISPKCISCCCRTGVIRLCDIVKRLVIKKTGTCVNCVLWILYTLRLQTYLYQHYICTANAYTRAAHSYEHYASYITHTSMLFQGRCIRCRGVMFYQSEREKFNFNIPLETRAFQSAIRIDSPIHFGQCFVRKLAIRFGRCIRLINDHMPWHSPILRRCISHSAVQLILLMLRNINWLNWVQIRKI